MLVSAATALLTPAAFGGILIGANMLVASQDSVMAGQGDAPKPPPPPTHRAPLSTLGRASAVAWISAGHTGR